MAAESTADPHGRAPRNERWDALGWIALGASIVIASWRMDRLEHQHINPYTVPGLVPGLLGIGMVLLGTVLAWRSRARRPAIAPDATALRWRRAVHRRIVVAAGLCVGYAVALVGHGLPFWLASTIYVTGSILVLERLDDHDGLSHAVDGEPPRARVSWFKALLIGLVSSGVTHVVFQSLFLVRLP